MKHKDRKEESQNCRSSNLRSTRRGHGKQTAALAETGRQSGCRRSRQSGGGGDADSQGGGREYAKANAVASKTMVSDCRVGAGGEIHWLAETNRAVLATLWEEATEEHGDDVFWMVAAGDELVGRDLRFQLVR
jgi:hypothetical protein